jgi:hypothetical protein
MNVAATAKTLASGMAVYVIMAACSAQEPTNRRTDMTSGGSAGLAGGAETGGLGGAGGVGPGGSGGTTGSMDGAAGTTMIADASMPPGTGGTSGSGGDATGVDGSGGTRADSSLLDRIVNPVPDADAQTTSGSRLKARYITTADGAKQFYGWRDIQRNEDCSFMTAGDGQNRCLPYWATPAPATVGVYWADAACSQPLAYVAKSTGGSCGATSVPIFGVKGDTSICPMGYRFYGIGAKSTATTIYSGTATACTGSTTPTTSYDFYTVNAEIPPTAFVAGSFVTDP